MVSRLEFATRDPERAMPVLEDLFPKARMRNPKENFSFEVASTDVDLFEVIHYHLMSPSSSSSVDTSGTLMIGVVDDGGLALASDREAIDTSRPWLYPQREVSGDWDDLTMTVLSLSIPDTVRFARQFIGSERFRLRFAGTSPVDDQLGRQWAALMRYLRQTTSEQGPVLMSDLVRANAHAHVVGTLLATFPNNVMEADSKDESGTAAPTTVRRAIEFMESNAHLPITIEDIARESRLSVRGLQYAFRSSLDVTPTAHLRRIRLAGAHESLRAASPQDGSTVAAIALKWGFVHPSRFAKQYREAYGVTPRRTLES
jgi:AraC-like DNA-binding protein